MRLKECVGNGVAEETGKGEQLLGAVTMTVASDEEAAHGSERHGDTVAHSKVQDEVATVAMKDTRNGEHLTSDVSITVEYEEEITAVMQPP